MRLPLRCTHDGCQQVIGYATDTTVQPVCPVAVTADGKMGYACPACGHTALIHVAAVLTIVQSMERDAAPVLN